MESLIIVILIIVFVIWLARIATHNGRQETPTRPRETTTKAEPPRPDTRPPARPNGKTLEPELTNLPQARSTPTMNSPLSPSSTPSSTWVHPGEEVTIAGYSISSGLIYVGTGLKAVGGYTNSIEPALIDPALLVANFDPDYSGSTMNYWPSYSTISPRARAAYLEWLARGRKDPSINISYVFLFFYGLERRVLIDAQKSEDARADVELIITEVERVLLILW